MQDKDYQDHLQQIVIRPLRTASRSFWGTVDVNGVLSALTFERHTLQQAFYVRMKQLANELEQSEKL